MSLQCILRQHWWFPRNQHFSICIFNFSNDVSLFHSKKRPLEVFCKKAVVRTFSKFAGKHLCNIILKSDSRKVVFVWIFWNFQEHLSYKTPPVASFALGIVTKILIRITKWILKKDRKYLKSSPQHLPLFPL